MKVSAVNTISFTSKANNAKEGRKRYFEYLSKNSANDALKMSKGREEKDGKFKFAEFVTGTGALMAGAAAISKYSKLASEYAKHYNPQTGAANFAAEEGKKFMRNNKIMGALMAGAAILGATACTIHEINRQSAEKTANERGFYTQQDRMKMKNSEEVYTATEQTYAKHTAE